MSLRALAISAFLLAAQPAAAQSWDGPFGLREGLTLEQVFQALPGLVEGDSVYVYQADTAPLPNPFLDGFYLYMLTPQAGLCGVVGQSWYTGDYSDSKNRYFQLKAALQAKYGDLSSEVQTKSKTIAKWVSKDTKDPTRTTFPHHISFFTLELRSGDVVLSYYFSNFAACSAEAKQANTEILQERRKQQALERGQGL